METLTAEAPPRLHVKRHDVRLRPNAARVLVRPFVSSNTQKNTNIVCRVMALREAKVERLLKEVLDSFSDRHLEIEEVLKAHFRRVEHLLPAEAELSRARKLLIGAYFTQEYALESAALFNPSIVAHPDQTGLAEGDVRFIMSLRATGEGHISSIVFRSGVISGETEITFDPSSRYVIAPEINPDASYDKQVFRQKLREMGVSREEAYAALALLGDHFTFTELMAQLDRLRRYDRLGQRQDEALRSIQWLAESNYEQVFDADTDPSERVIFPYSPSEQGGIEDARFVQFAEEDGSTVYYATYTAYDGQRILPQMIETRDFLRFKVHTLNGAGAENKGMALFPRKVGGRYAMISRQDNENLFLMYSDDVYFWREKEELQQPESPWEFVQIGNCGSPIETEAGWILLTHGVGPMRRYSIGALLLDLDDPSRVIGRLDEPLLAPNEEEREGYVPNVVYTCGALLHGRTLVLSYAMSDSATGVATVDVDELLGAMTA